MVLAVLVIFLILSKWRWAVEIGILAAGFYSIWRLFQGTRGARIMAGLVMLFVTLSLVAVALQLTVIVELLRSISTFAALALVVLFQPEIRRILAGIGTQHFVPPPQWQTQVIEAVVGAIEFLHQERHGALIAFERDIVYQPGHDTGTEIGATVTSDLLSTIFAPKTPLHDGGAVIRHDRIVTAAAIFPVTVAEGLERTLGLRHRAGLGLSDETDAVVVILSEETGTISIAVGGELERPLTVDQLRARLTELLGRGRDHDETADS